MPELRLIDKHSGSQSAIQRPIVQQRPTIEPFTASESEYVTAEQLDNKLGGVVDQIVKKIEPESALTPEVRGMVKAVSEVQSLRQALKDPTSAGIEEATSNLVTSVLSNALNNISGGGQQQAQPIPLRNTLAQIAVSNLTGENSPLPQLMDALTSILGKERVKEGYDAGIHYIDQQQRQNNLPATILQFDENSQEDVVAYAQQMGYSDVQYAQARLIEHKNRLNQEIEEYQRVQGGGQQSVAVEEPIVQQEPMRQQEPIIQQEVVVQQETMPQQEVVSQEPIIQQEQYVQPVVKEQYMQVEQKYIEEPVVVETIIEEPIVKKPVLKANRVVVLHGKPRKLTLAKDKVEQAVNGIDHKIEVDKNLNIDVTHDEGNEGNESSDNDNKSLDDDVDDILSDIGE